MVLNPNITYYEEKMKNGLIIIKISIKKINIFIVAGKINRTIQLLCVFKNYFCRDIKSNKIKIIIHKEQTKKKQQ